MRAQAYFQDEPSFRVRLYNEVVGDLYLRLASKPRRRISTVADLVSRLVWAVAVVYMCLFTVVHETSTLWRSLTGEAQRCTPEDLSVLDKMAATADAELLPMIDLLREAFERELIADGKAAEIMHLRSELV